MNEKRPKRMRSSSTTITQTRSRRRPLLAASGYSLISATALVLLACLPSCTLAVLTSPAIFRDLLPTSGPIDDATCNIEELEQANDLQLFTILYELKNTAMFRNVVVDLDHKCPLTSWGGGGGGGDEDAQEENDFDCDGGKDELDEDAEPLCTVASYSGAEDPFGFESNALNSLSQEGFQSKAQQDTFSWKQHSDVVVSEIEEPCDDDGLLPDSFWLDMCSNIQAGDGTNVVNLALNPERNTAYNGTHIWKAIYEENCVVTNDGGDSDMCLEERVLYRLLSGLHTSTTISIAMNYHPPSKKKGRVKWEPNPAYFMEKFQDNPEHIRNLHFAYVVTLRALRKASPFLYDYEIRTGDIVEDETAAVLLKRLLDSAILKSCSNIFSAFDESVMFKESNQDVVSLQQNFKGVFHNVSSILDCVQCQQCKLHGKMAMLGYGTALKILFMKPENLELERNEIVALINTIAKLSESIRHVRELAHLYVEQQDKPDRSLRETEASLGVNPTTGTAATMQFGDDPVSVQLVDMAVGLASSLGKNGAIDFDRELELVELALARNPDLLILVKYYSGDQNKFLQLAQSVGSLGVVETLPDAIVIGSGLAGLAACLNILDRGGSVVLIEKEHLLGGNSNKASSGINAYVPSDMDDDDSGDALDIFFNDTLRSAGSSARPELVETLVSKSGDAVTWLKERVGVDLSLKAQLGGHAKKRTHRPSNGMAGAEIIYGVQKAVRAFEKTGKIQIHMDTRVVRLLTDPDGRVNGVEYVGLDGETNKMHAPNVILATGGFAADRSAGSFLEHYRPELLQMSTTAGNFSTGDGIALATLLGAKTVDMDKVQIHPTGWVDPADPESTSKILAAELMRGVGGLLLNASGDRFCNELGNRAYVSDQMLSHNPTYAKNGVWDPQEPIPVFNLVLSSSAAEDGKKHVDLYSHKGLLTRLEGVTELARWMGLAKDAVVATLKQYQTAAKEEADEFGKTSFRGVPGMNLDKEVFYAGKVTPVLHYCMGGITIDKEGNVLTEDGSIIRGLHAAGEVTGGVHGVNRLGGNSLLECTVFGTIVGQKIPVQISSRTTVVASTAEPAKERKLRSVHMSELEGHNTPENCWVAIHGSVYDLTEFAEDHPAGPESVVVLAGKDGTEAFSAVHSAGILDDFADERIGPLV